MDRDYALFAVLMAITVPSVECGASPPEIQRMELDPRPSERVPLAAQVRFRSDHPTTVALEFDDGERGWSVDVLDPATTNHVVPILGMRSDRTHLVRIIVTTSPETQARLSPSK